MIRALIRPALAALAAISAVLAPGLASAASDQPKPLFAASDVIHLTIKGPLPKIGENAGNTPTVDTLTVAGAAPEILPITLAARGITRRKTDTCQFPPLRVEFTEKPGAGSLFAGQKKLKLVTHCRADPHFQQYVLLEYAAYRMYNVLTPLSIRVRLAQVDYVGADGKLLISRTGFFEEDPEDVAKRNGLYDYKTESKVSIGALRPGDAARDAAFQYLISNLDWAMTAGPPGANCCHNTKLLGVKDASSDLIVLPYDFDFSGLVSAPYASPPEDVPVPDVRTRRYRGYCAVNAEAPGAVKEIIAKRTALMAVLDEVPGLDDASHRRAQAYLGGFFEQIVTPSDVATKMLKTCLG